MIRVWRKPPNHPTGGLDIFKDLGLDGFMFSEGGHCRLNWIVSDNILGSAPFLEFGKCICRELLCEE